MHNVNVQVASHLDVLYTVEFHSDIYNWEMVYLNFHLDTTVPNRDKYVYLEHIFR